MLTILLIASSLLIILATLEAAMYYLTHHPEVLRVFPRKFRNSITYLYIHGDRKIMQFQSGCGMYSPDLGYTLQPGSFTFTGIGYGNEYRINSLGIRDDEQSLTAPELIFLGDSFTVGWGVDQEKTFAKLLGEKTNLKTLNTAVPSYGTVREMIMLRKVDRSQAKCLILQYCGDDYDENRLYFINGNHPQILRAETFQKMLRQHSESNKHYYPGKYIELKIKKKYNEWKPQPAKTDNAHPLSEVDLFIHILKQNEDLLAHLPLIVFEMNGINQTNEFTMALRKMTTDPNQPAFIRNMTILDLTQYLKDKHFLVLDGHLNDSGHVAVTNVLYETISQMGILPH
jgi:hypothetical protein